MTTDDHTYLRYPLSALVSFHYYPDPDLVARLHAGGLRMIGDSGAFSALSIGKPMDLDRYIDWCHAVRDHTTWLASLDVIGDAEASWKNWLRLREADLDVIPTVHYGEPPVLLDRYADRGVDMVGLGGMVGRKGEQTRLLRWTVAMFRHARVHHPDMRFHGWGVTHPKLVMNLPWWSVDSSGFGQAYRFGRLKLFDPDTKRTEGADLNGRDVYRLGGLLRKHYGTTPSTLEYSTPANRPHVIRVSARSFQLLEDYLRGRHHVPAPEYGVREPGQGTSVAVVDGASWCYPELTRPPEGTNVHCVDVRGPLDQMILGTSVHAALSSEDPHLMKGPPA